MAVHHLIDEGQASASQVPDVLAMDNVPVGTGASIVVAVAAAIAVVLTILVATLSSVVSASAMPLPHNLDRTGGNAFVQAGFADRPAAEAAYRITEVLPARDGTFAVVSKGMDDSSLAPAVLAALLVMTLVAGTHAVRGLGTRLAGPARTRREPRTAKPARGR